MLVEEGQEETVVLQERELWSNREDTCRGIWVSNLGWMYCMFRPGIIRSIDKPSENYRLGCNKNLIKKTTLYIKM